MIDKIPEKAWGKEIMAFIQHFYLRNWFVQKYKYVLVCVSDVGLKKKNYNWEPKFFSSEFHKLIQTKEATIVDKCPTTIGLVKKVK